ncbi:hypothetical protein PspLS_07254 [Pyricularia sp. CBS 133598]|nr:hypothetical protein PspLS_07254 [Pyricularia sp. CBS 133598]
MMNEPAAPCIISRTLQQLALILIGGSANRSADTNNSSIIVSKFPSRLVPCPTPFSCSSSRAPPPPPRFFFFPLPPTHHMSKKKRRRRRVDGTKNKPTIAFLFLPSDL